ncbi:MAG: hypothetical protein L0219_03165, partial [Phycisphaerales bacterium]|nr:hypothetical protein [Phycisphaerales bacterium]
DVAGTLIDGGSRAPNIWSASGGIRVFTLPGTSDLLGTTVTIQTRPFGEANNFWPANDLGTNTAGFTTNLALGRLTLDGGTNSLFTFDSGTGDQAAMYVAYLELLGSATDPASIEIAENMTVYFADSNVDPATINMNLHPRLRWAPGFVAPTPEATSSQPAPAPSVNPARLQSVTLDSDGDGIVNVFDSSPLFTADKMDLRVSYTSDVTSKAVVSWMAPPQSISVVEYRDSLQAGTWQPKPPVSNTTALAQRLSLSDTLATGSAQRFYRVRLIQQQ